MVGVNAGDGVNFKKFKNSLTDDVIEVLNYTNMRDCNLKGQYVYQIDTVSTFDDSICKGSTARGSIFPNLGNVNLCSPGECAYLCILANSGKARLWWASLLQCVNDGTPVPVCRCQHVVSWCVDVSWAVCWYLQRHVCMACEYAGGSIKQIVPL